MKGRRGEAVNQLLGQLCELVKTAHTHYYYLRALSYLIRVRPHLQFQLPRSSRRWRGRESFRESRTSHTQGEVI